MLRHDANDLLYSIVVLICTLQKSRKKSSLSYLLAMSPVESLKTRHIDFATRTLLHKPMITPSREEGVIRSNHSTSSGGPCSVLDIT